MDPLAEKSYGWSPYNYTYYNSLKFTDKRSFADPAVYSVGEYIPGENRFIPLFTPRWIVEYGEQYQLMKTTPSADDWLKINPEFIRLFGKQWLSRAKMHMDIFQEKHRTQLTRERLQKDLMRMGNYIPYNSSRHPAPILGWDNGGLGF